MNFDRNRFYQTLQTLPWESPPSPITLYPFNTLASTNKTAWELLNQNLPTPLLVIAQRQTAGQGQWGRQWQSQPGGLYLSLALTSPHPLDSPLTLAIALGIAQTLRQWDIPIQLKWPNDLILHGQKLGGIKTERHTRPNHSPVVIGVGINWHNPTPPTAINLQNYSQIAQLEQLAALTVHGIISGYQPYLQEGLTNLLPHYWDLLTHQGQDITIQNQRGKIVGITAQGALRVRLATPSASTEITCPIGSISWGIPTPASPVQE
ncbi:biotin--[acetyl-CoA-carboxylase] ligase [Spirulina sp. CS-785/01]|uniref:biotin--[acetyl-CoA-carboxylase] ligase n=1 Tax=Spirulina sp. CS-785/01 TaxID=3021716 RepID=UPI00232EB3A5|nr:biotin--[acetyl-CoA-carboxylase] ligase [Spirulina sp. CS-785/01]MDB9314730.1 biotin--[acetyl-CoA-carboxylase] ligase [Spirulina sp. CS-785/01]